MVNIQRQRHTNSFKHLKKDKTNGSNEKKY